MIVLKRFGGVLSAAHRSLLGVMAVLFGEWLATIPVRIRGYASKVLAGVPYDAVLAARRWHPLIGGRSGWDCSFAVVRLPDDAPELPPKEASTRQRDWVPAWGRRDWIATPDRVPCDNCRDAVATCSTDFDEDTAAHLARALASPGSWAQRDGVGETLSICSAPERIAARVRGGD